MMMILIIDIIFRLMHIKQLGATIYSAQALFKLTVKLQLEQQYLQLLHTVVGNLILAYSFGR